MAKDRIDGYVAREGGGGLMFFTIKPGRHQSRYEGRNTWIGRGATEIYADHPLGKDLTWEDEPKPVKLVAAL